MKQSFLICIVLLSPLCAHAQDLITKKDGEDIQAKIIEVTQTEIKYKKFSNQDGPTFVLPKSEILIVRYQDGTNEIFDYKPNDNSRGQENGPYALTPYAGEAIDKIRPRMEYKDYKKLYDPKKYSREDGDRYNPGVCGFLSFLVPGVGQFVCGQVGRGFVWLGSSLGCTALIVSGMIIELNETPSFERHNGILTLDDKTRFQDTLATILMVAGGAGLVTVDVWSICDAIKMAKIKNMYNNDVRYIRSISMNLQPSVSNIRMGDSAVPVLGATLALNF